MKDLQFTRKVRKQGSPEQADLSSLLRRFDTLQAVFSYGIKRSNDHKFFAFGNNTILIALVIKKRLVFKVRYAKIGLEQYKVMRD